MFGSLQQRSLTTSHRLRQRNYRFPHVRRSAKRRRIAKRRPLFFASVAFVLFSALCVIGTADWDVKNVKIVARDKVQNVPSDNGTKGAIRRTGPNGHDLEVNFAKGPLTFGIVSKDPSKMTIRYDKSCKFALGTPGHLVQFETATTDSQQFSRIIKFADHLDRFSIGPQTIQFEKDQMIMGADKQPVQNGDATDFGKGDGRFLRVYRVEAPLGCNVTAVFKNADLAVLTDPPPEPTDKTLYIAIGLGVGAFVIFAIIVVGCFFYCRAAKKAEKEKANEAAKKGNERKTGPKAEKKNDTRLVLDTMAHTTIVTPTKREKSSHTKTKDELPTKSKTTGAPNPTNNRQQSEKERSGYERRPPHLAQQDVSIDARTVIETKLPKKERKIRFKAENNDDTELYYEERDDEKKSSTKEDGTTRKSSTRTAVEPQEKPKKKRTLLNGYGLWSFSWGNSSLTVDKTQEDAPAAEEKAKK